MNCKRPFVINVIYSATPDQYCLHTSMAEAPSPFGYTRVATYHLCVHMYYILKLKYSRLAYDRDLLVDSCVKTHLRLLCGSCHSPINLESCYVKV